MSDRPDAASKAAGIGCLSIILIAGIAGLWAWHSDEATQSAPFNAGTAIHVSASEMASDWASNEVAASKKYTGTSIVVTGEVGKISGAGDAHPNVYLNGTDVMADADLILRTESDALPLLPGETATFDCVGARQSLSQVVIDACTLEKGSIAPAST